jgi:hypothetical protein
LRFTLYSKAWRAGKAFWFFIPAFASALQKSGNIDLLFPEVAMKVSASLAFFVFMCEALAEGQISSQGANQGDAPVPGASAETSKIDPRMDPGKVADIRHLLDLIHAAALATQAMASAETSVRPLMVSSFRPGAYRDELIELFFAKFHSKLSGQALVNLLVPIYDKHLTGDDVKGLILFYETPLGQKMITVLPQVMAESQEAGRKWGENLGHDSIMEVLAQHPDLAKAAEAANKPSEPK